MLRAAYTVATAGGRTPLSRADERAISSASRTVFGHPEPVDVAGLACVPSSELVRVVDDASLALDLVRVLAVLALVDGVVEKAKLALVLDVASALHVRAEFVDAIHQLWLDHVRWVAFEMIRANVMTIPGAPWRPDDPYGPFLPYGGDAGDPVLAERYERLAHLAEGTLGRTFFEHYRDHGYAFPGSEEGLIESWATPHDCLHILSGYSTSAQGELLVAAFTGGSLAPGTDFMESHVLPTILIYHFGIDINKGLNSGDKDRMESDPSWADNYDGNVHLGLDAEKLWVAWQRGVAMRADLYSGHWDFWAHVATPLEDLRERWHVPPLDPAMEALGDDEVSRQDFERPGIKLPPAVSSTPIADRPPAPPSQEAAPSAREAASLQAT